MKDSVLGDYPFPNLPYLIDGDLKMTQSNAIIRHLGRKFGLTGASVEEMAKVDIILEEGMDFRCLLLVYLSEFDLILFL